MQESHHDPSELIGMDSFRETHRKAYVSITKRLPSSFESATGDALWRAFRRLDFRDMKERKTHAFLAVSAATGSGKTVGTCALMAHLSPAPCAFVINTVEECEHVYRQLSKLLPGKVAVYTSLHRVDARRELIEEKQRELGLVVERRFTEQEFKEAQVVITTHERWKSEVERHKDLGVRLHRGKPRALVVVDEDPSLERVYVKQPEDVSRLASVLADNTLSNEARAFGFTTSHHAADALAGIHARMREVKDNAQGGSLYGSELVTAEDAEALDALKFGDISARLSHLDMDARLPVADSLWDTVKFLKAAAQGRVFYSRGSALSAFYAYELMLEAQPRTIVLDGTADLNGMYALGKHVVVVDHDKPDYSRVSLTFVNPPRQFAGKMKPDKLLKARRNAEPFMQWFLPFLVKNTREGEQVLVYAKQGLLAYDIHKGPQWDHSGSADPFYSELEGRRIHWCHFGRGRGSNQWKDCTTYFRLSDGHMPKAALLAKVGSVTGKIFTAEELASLSCGTTRDPLLKLAQDAHLVTSHKQDAARICIRNLTNNGTAAAASIYLVDCDKWLLSHYRERMFPGSTPYQLMAGESSQTVPGTTTDGERSRRGNESLQTVPGTTTDGGDSRRDGVNRLADLLMTHAGELLTGEQVADETGLTSGNINRALSSPKVAPIAQDHGWVKTTRKAVGLSGKGYVLSRAA